MAISSLQWGRRLSTTEIRPDSISGTVSTGGFNGAVVFQRRRLGRYFARGRFRRRLQWGRRLSTTEIEHDTRRVGDGLSFNGAVVFQRRRSATLDW